MELSIVVAILSIVATLGLETAASFINRSSTSVSRARLKVVDEALDNFFTMYGRLPCPAVLNYDPMHQSGATYDYGLENCAGSVVINVGTATAPGNGIYIGALPFRVLNLPMSYSLDGFADKFNYVVTANLTAAGGSTTVASRFGSSGFATVNQNGAGGIEVRSGQLAQPCNTSKCNVVADPSIAPMGTGAAYFVYSSGPDQRGAVNTLGTSVAPCSAAAAGTDPRPDTQNCVFGNNGTRTKMTVTTIPYNVFYDNRYNPGLNLASYFDDVAIWRTKAQL